MPSRRTDENVTGRVVAQQPPGDGQATPGSEVHLVVSDGPKPVEVPNVVGKTYEEATKSADRRSASRSAARTSTATASPPARSSVTTRWQGAEAPRDSTVIVVVSRGPDVVTVGDYQGETVEDAVERPRGGRAPGRRRRLPPLPARQAPGPSGGHEGAP